MARHSGSGRRVSFNVSPHVVCFGRGYHVPAPASWAGGVLGQPRHVHGHQPENWPFSVLRALYLRSDSEEPRSQHITSGLTLER